MMNRTALLFALLAGAVSGCADQGDESLIILRNAEPDGTCSADPDTDIFIAHGLIDVNAGRGYIMTPLVENTAIPTDDRSRLAFVSGANVDVLFETDIFSEAELAGLLEQGLTSFGQRFSYSIEAGAVASIQVEVVPLLLLDAIAAKLALGESTLVTAEVSLLGTIHGGEVQSNPFAYPITVCNGCLQVNHGDCAALPDDFVAENGGSCQTLQDGVIDCCTTDGQLVCPAVKPPEEPI